MICKKCGKELDESAIMCPQCGATTKPKGKAVAVWAMVMAFLIPFVGIILSIIATVKGAKYKNKTVLILGICALVIAVIMQILYIFYVQSNPIFK